MEHFEDLRRRLFTGLVHEFSAYRGVLTFGNGSRIIAGHFQAEKDIDAYLGLEYDVIGIEEATTLSSRKHTDISTCCRTSKSNWRPRIYSTSNPGGIGHAWYRTRFIVPFQERRETRGERIVERINSKLRGEGRAEIAVEAVRAIAEGALGRPHIARVLMEAGYVKEMEDAFTRYLEPCNVPKEYFPITDAIDEIHRLGGVAVLAHPQSVSDDRTVIRRLIGELKAMGLDGIEAHNTMGTANDALTLERLAMDLGLLATGGSDFHGFSDDSPLGTIRGVPIPARCGTELLARLNRQ